MKIQIPRGIATNPYLPSPRKVKLFPPKSDRFPTLRRTVAIASYVLAHAAFCFSVTALNVAFARASGYSLSTRKFALSSILEDFFPPVAAVAVSYISSEIYYCTEVF